MAKIVCKFKLDRIERMNYNDGELQNLVLTAVYQGDNPDSENSKFWKWTPSGKLEVATVNAEAVKDLELGKEYYITITDQKPE